MFEPGTRWLDTAGRPIQAHGGAVLHDRGCYYWFGENKDGPTTVEERVDIVGISCYSSADLREWRDEGVVLPAVPDDAAHDLHPSRIAERPAVIYNDRTGLYVMWLHVDRRGYSYARAGVAVSDRPAGPYRYLGSMRPCDADCRDLTVFKDRDGAAYLVFSSEWHRNITVALLAGDYLSIGDAFIKTLVHARHPEGREAPAIFEHNGVYYLITSGCTGWAPNPASYAVAPSMLGPWEPRGNPCVGRDAETTFRAQGTHVFAVAGMPNAYIFMADRWNSRDLRDSRYVWLPIQLHGDALIIEWRDRWDLSVFAERGGADGSGACTIR